MKIKAISEVIRGMAGEVRYWNTPCPFGEKSNVGTTWCKMCPHHGGMEDDVVTCNHE
jgi:hypothetical protein